MKRVNEYICFREQRVKARRNNKDLLKEELEFLKQYLKISRVKTGQVAESKYIYILTYRVATHNIQC